ncbi:RE1-silencing transcription factor A-like [Ptychodera flava]|uniref:RE1-silencing transcription factor A-like n=1 Tax=Ptychodera flava TaxID=63121 RepID=UPI00396A5B68
MRHKSTVTWYRWETVSEGAENRKKKSLVRKTGTTEDLVNELIEELTPFPQHLFNAYWQYAQFTNATKKHPSDTVVLCMDFAENYTCQLQNEVQAAHWTHTQVTIHPVIAYYKENGKEVREAIVFVSDDLNHDSHAVHVFTGIVNTHMKDRRNLDMQKMIIFSDGCAAQYKSRTPFADVSFAKEDMNCTLERNFFGSRHGKGPCDGEGGVVKAAITRAVKNEVFIPSDAKSVYDFCRKSLSKESESFKRTFYWIPTYNIQRNRPSRLVKTVKGTRQLHSVLSTGEAYVLKKRPLSCYCSHCMLGNADECDNQEWVEPWRDLKLFPIKNVHHDVNPEPSVIQCNEPCVIQSNTPGVIQSNEPCVIQSNTPGVIQSNEPCVIESNEPSVIQSNEPSVIQSNTPDVIQSNEPNVIQSNEPSVIQSNNEPSVIQSNNEPKVIQSSEPSIIEFNTPSVIQSNTPSVIQSNEPSVIQSNTPGVIQSNEPSVIQSNNEPSVIQSNNEPKVIQSSEPSIIEFNTPSVIQSNEPSVIQSNEPSVIQSNMPGVIQSNEPSVIQSNDDECKSTQADERCKLHICDYVLTNVYNTRGRPQVFLGQIVQQDDALYQVKYMKKVGNGRYIWPTQDDVSWLPMEDIINTVNLKLLTSRGHFIFNEDEISSKSS